MTATQGEPGHASALTPARVKVLGGFVVAVMLVFAFVLQVQVSHSTANTARIGRLVRAQCLAVTQWADGHNGLIDETITSVRASTTLTAKEKTDRIRRYDSVRAIKPDCGGKK